LFLRFVSEAITPNAVPIAPDYADVIPDGMISRPHISLKLGY